MSSKGRAAAVRLTLALAAALAAGAAAASDCSVDVADLRAGATEVRFRIEVADDEAERNQGLMFREAMPRFEGMLFVYEREQPVSFWMKNTLIPLDMLFFDATGRLTHVHENAVPGDLTPIPSEGPAQFVLEINGGAARALGIGPGAELRHPAVAPATATWSCAIR